MAHTLSYETNMSKIQNSNLFTFIATLAGVAIGVMASLAMMGPMVRSEVSSATSGLRTINAKPTDSVTSCVAPSGGASNAASVKTAAATMPEAGKGGDQGQGGGNTWVNKFVGGGMNTANTTVSGNMNSPTVVTTTNKNITKINNDNDVHVSNTNVQVSGSGKAEVEHNYNGGSAASGDSSNSNDSSTSISISN